MLAVHHGKQKYKEEKNSHCGLVVLRVLEDNEGDPDLAALQLVQGVGRCCHL